MVTRLLAGLLAGGLLVWADADASAQQPPWLDQWQQQPGPQQPRQPLPQQPTLPPGTVFQPPPTIPSVPVPTPVELPTRPGQLFEFKLGTDLVEEYSDNFFFASVHPTDNLRTLLVPRGILFLHSAYVEGLIQTRLSTAWDSSTKTYSFFPDAGAQITAEVTPRWTLGGSGSFVQTDNPAATNRLGIQPQRNKSTSFTLGATSNYAFTTLALRQSYGFNRIDQAEGSSTTGHTAGGGASLTLAQIHVLSLDYTYTHNETTGGTSGNGSTGTGATGTGSQTTSSDQKTTNESNGFVVSLSREVSPRLVAGVSANYGWNTTQQTGSSQGSTTTSSSSTAQGSTTTDFTRYGAGFFSTYTLPFLVFRGSLGFIHLSGSDVDETALSSMTGLTYFTGPLSVDLSVESGFSESFLGNTVNFGVVKTQSGTFGVAYAFTPKMTARIGGSYRQNEQTGLGGGGTAGNKTAVGTASASVSWQALQWFAISLDYVYTNSRTLDGGSSTSTTSGTSTGTGTTNNNLHENHARISLKFDF